MHVSERGEYAPLREVLAPLVNIEETTHNTHKEHGERF